MALSTRTESTNIMVALQVNKKSLFETNVGAKKEQADITEREKICIRAVYCILSLLNSIDRQTSLEIWECTQVA